MVKKVAIAELKAHLSETLRRVEAGDRVAIERHGKTKGRKLDDAGLRIAAICRSRSQTLVSGNARHFARVPGLRYENWLA